MMLTSERTLADVVRAAEPDADAKAVEAGVARLRRRLLLAEQSDGREYMTPPPSMRVVGGPPLRTTDADLAIALRRRDWAAELRERRDEERDERLAGQTANIRATATALVAIADQLDAHGCRLDNHECRLCALEGGGLASPHECQPMPARRARKPGPKARAEAERLIAAGVPKRRAARAMGIEWRTFRRMLGRAPLPALQSSDIPNEVA